MPVPPRFAVFVLVFAAGAAAAIPALGWPAGVMLAFDVAAAIFLASCLPLLRHPPGAMREAARRNDANRPLLLATAILVMLVILVVVARELTGSEAIGTASVVLVLATLALAWTFSNTVYALHYAHMYYGEDADGGDRGGLDFPGTSEPEYLDFAYFALCLGMTFQTADVSMTDRRFRRVATIHCLAAFVFNLGILAFTISVLSG